MANTFKQLRARAQAQAADPPAARLSAREYAKLMLGIDVFIGLLLFSFIFSNGDKTWTEIAFHSIRFLVVVLFTFGTHLVLRYQDNAVRGWLDRQSVGKNRALRMGASVLVLIASMFGTYYFDRLVLGTCDPTASLKSTLLGALIFALILVSVQVALEAVERSRFLFTENQQLKQEQLQARYESLKHQLSPHFLFNSLSTLSGLIQDEPAAAEQFVEDMAQVYRYLLRHGEQQAVPLREELAFLQSYVYLLQRRFGESLQLQLDLPEAILNRLVPPLTLQLLVENAVKHNALTRRQPLAITIAFQVPATLVVRNTRQPRLTPESSSGLGLSNLTNRIRLLHGQQLLVDSTADAFSVYVPLPA